MAGPPISLARYRQLVGQQVGASRWFLIDQPRIDRFAEVTEDAQFIHIDPASAAKTPFGGTIAHGFLSLSLLSAMAASVIPPVDGAEMAINYGMNRVRFLKPVRSGRRLRGVFVLKDLQERDPGQWQSTFNVEAKVEFEETPALVAEWLVLSILPRPIMVAWSAGDPAAR